MKRITSLRNVLSLVILIAVFLTGCAATPKVEYARLAPDHNGMLKFTLPRSQFLISPSLEDKSVPSVTSVPTDEYPGAEERTLMMRAVSGGMVSTSITQATYAANTRILSGLGFAVKDSRSELISMAQKALPLLGIAASTGTAPSADEIRPEVIDPFDEDGKLTNRKSVPLKINSNWKYSLEFSQATGDSITYSEFEKIAFTNQPASVIPYPSCANAVLTLIKTIGTSEVPVSTIKLKVADPSNVQTIALPVGKISMHTGCGYDVTNDPSSGSLNTDALSHLIDLAKSLKSAK